MPRHTREEINEAIAAAKMLYERDGALTSQTLLKELETRTGKPPKYWHIIELLAAIKAEKNGTRSKAVNYRLTAKHERLILAAAEIITGRQAVPKISPEDIRQYFKSRAGNDPTANTAAITHASSADINEILRKAGYTQYKTGNYITSIPPARHTDELETRALRILEAAEDPQSGIAEKLHDIRYRHKFRDATAEELQAAVLDGFMQGDASPDAQAFNHSANTATKRKTRRRIRKYGRRSAPTAEAMSAAHRQAFRDLKDAREAAGKTPAPIEDTLYFLYAEDRERRAEAKAPPRTRKYKFEPTRMEAALRNRADAEDETDSTKSAKDKAKNNPIMDDPRIGDGRPDM